jgi:hypothetical protein
VEASSEGACGKERDNMGRHTRLEAVISFLSNARRHKIIIIKTIWNFTQLQRKTTH